jgi:hypothetical protein
MSFINDDLDNIMGIHFGMTDDQRLSALIYWYNCGGSLQTPMLCSSAAQYGHIKSLQYLHETHGCQINNNACCLVALRAKSLDCLRYIFEHCNNVVYLKGTYTAFVAAKIGDVDCMQYIHEQGCAWSSETCDAAARHGHVECLQYAHQHGAPWTSKTTNITAEHVTRYGNYACLRYAYDNGCLEPTVPKYINIWNDMITRNIT